MLIYTDERDGLKGGVDRSEKECVLERFCLVYSLERDCHFDGLG